MPWKTGGDQPRPYKPSLLDPELRSDVMGKSIPKVPLTLALFLGGERELEKSPSTGSART